MYAVGTPGGNMTASYRGWLLAMCVVAALIPSLEPAIAQSFYDAITAVARTEVRKPVQTSRVPPAAAAMPVPVPEKSPATETYAGNPHRQQVARPVADAVQKPAAKIGKSDGYRYKAQAAASAKAWPSSEIHIARARCNFILSNIKAEVVGLDPIKNGACGDPAPVKLVSVGSKPKVTFDPPVLVNCDMVQSLHDWIIKDLQPLARRHLKSPVTNVETMSSYSCRNAYGRKDTRLSQHARANAIDIRGFRTAKQREAMLLAHWGPTQRDINASLLAAKREKEAAEKRVAAAKEKQGKKSRNNRVAVADRTAGNHDTTAERKQTGSLIAAGQVGAEAAGTGFRLSFRPTFLDSFADKEDTALGVAPSRLGGPAISALEGKEVDAVPSWPLTLASKKVDMTKAETPRARFLRGAHRTACNLFGTVLGPEANRAHRNHFHVDLARRELGNYCR